LIKIYGASDDLIEIESDNQEEFHSEEFNVSGFESNVLALSDGTLLEIRFDRWGVWRITPLAKGNNFLYILGAETDIESDIAFLDARNLKWIVLSRA